MHQPIRDNLEDYLKGSARRVPQEFHAHLAACRDCAGELRLLEAQAKMLRSLHCEEEIEPRAGFYARVMERIEQQVPASIWSILLQPSFGRRLAIASATLVVLLGTYLVTTEPGDASVASNSPVVMTDDRSEPQAAVSQQDTLQQQRERDAVLVNLASYHE